jgi:hypothetical protein
MQKDNNRRKNRAVRGAVDEMRQQMQQQQMQQQQMQQQMQQQQMQQQQMQQQQMQQQMQQQQMQQYPGEYQQYQQYQQHPGEYQQQPNTGNDAREFLDNLANDVAMLTKNKRRFVPTKGTATQGAPKRR